MTPEYLRELADVADPEELWRLSLHDAASLTPAARQRLDTGIALRRYAAHIAELGIALGLERSVLITPLTPHHTAVKIVVTPVNHARLRKQRT